MWNESDFSGLILSRDEKAGVKKLRKHKELRYEEIPGFDGLRQAGFVELSRAREPDGFGGFKDDIPYRLSEKWSVYVKYRQRSVIARIIGKILDILDVV